MKINPREAPGGSTVIPTTLGCEPTEGHVDEEGRKSTEYVQMIFNDVRAGAN